MRIHGTDVERELHIQDADPPVHDSLLKARACVPVAAVHLRTELAGHVERLHADAAVDDGLPDDRTIDTIDDAFMFGPSFLVHPVTRDVSHPAALRRPS
jgi:alpha-D-xyloside xylohydrolase